MGKFQDLTGQKFGRLTVIKRDKNKYGRVTWLCRCECGNMCIVTANSLKTGNSTSCGCFRKEHPNHTKHNQRHTRLYKIWLKMKQRCFNSKDKSYKNYGGRGITMYDKWVNDFMSFYYWSKENGYKEDLSIDRIDNNGNYEPNNCRWTDKKTQNRNTRSNHKITYNGKTMCIIEWAEELGINYSTLKWRIYNNWSIEKAFNIL